MAGHAHADGHGDHHGLAHVASLKTLIATFVSLVTLTILTVVLYKLHMGLGVALLIAAIKASLVAAFFMHLRYDRLFHTVLVVGGLLAAILFIGFALMDRGQYDHDVVWDEDNPPAIAPGPSR